MLANTHPLPSDLALYQHFTMVDLHHPTEADMMAVLKEKCIDFENYHHISIPEEILPHVFALAERYLSTGDTLESALLLLDSSAARAAVQDANETPTLTLTVLTQVLADWTNIPASHLEPHQFKLSEFVQGMQQRIFGQEAAITLFGHAIQRAQAHLHHNLGPFCSFLLAGPEHSGKKSTTLALVEQLFKQLNLLYFAEKITPSMTSLMNVKLQRCFDKHYAPLKEVIQETPYAVILFTHIEQASTDLVEQIHQLLATGHVHDENGADYNFRQAIILFSTTLAGDRLTELASLLEPIDDDEPVDLLELVMNEQKHHPSPQKPAYTAQELTDEIMPDILAHLPEPLCQYLHVVPFLPLDKASIEKIIRLKLKILARQLDARYSIELTYAPEAIRFLTNEVLITQTKHNRSVDIDKVLKQLYFCIEHAIFSHGEHTHPTHLTLQLNETGQLLRCDWQK